MNKTQKDTLKADLKDKFSRAKIAIFADYKGLSANQADALRRVLRAEQTTVKVLKNNIARKVMDEGNFGADAKAIADSTVGPTLVAFGFGDASATAKVIAKFAKENDALKLKDSLFENKKISAKEIEAIASLPSREVLLSMLLSTLNGPARNFVSVLAAVPRGLVTVLDAVGKKKSEGQQ